MPVDAKAAARGLLANKPVLIGLAALVVLLAWLLWPSGKPPELCGGTMARPGQAIPSLTPQTGQSVLRIMGDDCTLSAQPATQSEIKEAQALEQRWRSYERAQLQGGGTLASQQGSLWVKAINLLAGPVGTFFMIILGAWAVLLGVALIVFLIGFLVVAVIGLRHAPLLVLIAPIMVWWKLLIEIPKNLCMQLLGVAHAKRGLGSLQTQIWQALLEMLGLRAALDDQALNNIGSARFADANEIAQRDQHKGATLQLGSLGGQPLVWHTEKHVLILAGSREGKGRDLLVPNLLQYPGSMLVLDPKGEHYKDTSHRRGQLGKVRVLAPWGIKGVSDSSRFVRFNPVKLIMVGSDEAVDVADVLAHSLVLPTGGDTHWSNSARGLWRALLLHIASDPAYEGHRDMIIARRSLTANFLPPKKSEQPPGSAANGESPEKPRRISTLERMIANRAFGGVIAEFAISLYNTPEKEQGSIISNAQRQTDFLDTPAMRKALAAQGQGEEIDFAEWRREKSMTCYLCIPADRLEGSGQRWVRLAVSAALNEMMREAPDSSKEQKLPVQFILDEIASLDRLEQVERALGLAAGFGVQLWAVWQDIPQMKELYKARWASFFGNAGARYMFGIGDYETSLYVSNLLGMTTVTTTSRAFDALGIEVTSRNQSAQQRQLMTPDEVMNIGPDEMLVSLSGVRPALAHRRPWYEDPALKNLGGRHEMPNQPNLRLE